MKLQENQSKSKQYKKGLIEALIFLSSEPLRLGSLADAVQLEKEETRELLNEILLDYSEKNGGFLLREIAGGYQFLSNEVYRETLGQIFKEKRKDVLSKSNLETLAIIAYKQPITTPEIDEIRGVSSRANVMTLISKKLVKPVGQKEVPGRPTLYGTTNDFLMHFGLNKLSDLPTLSEIKELKFENLDDLLISKSDEEIVDEKLIDSDEILDVDRNEPVIESNNNLINEESNALDNSNIEIVKNQINEEQLNVEKLIKEEDKEMNPVVTIDPEKLKNLMDEE